MNLSRISKLLIDRNQIDAETALVRRQACGVTLCCGEDVALSYTLQLAALTAARIACRCFPGGVRVALTPLLAQAPLLIWPWLRQTFGEALVEILGPDALTDNDAVQMPNVLLFGSAPSIRGALRITFDGWIAKVGPASEIPRLAEREYFSIAGALAASLALSESFLSFAGISFGATRRIVGMSLWRPDLEIGDDDALGVPVEYLPGAVWVLGLGHLGNAYLWSLATLPYESTKEVEFALLDFDRVEKENVETGIILSADDVKSFKARACDTWLGRCGFRTRLVERRFDATFRLQDQEPKLALCGFDSNPSRRDVPNAQFKRVIDSGLGGMASNFDTISIHTLPNPRAPADLWPDLSEEERAKLAAHHERMARENPGYCQLGGDDCGRHDLAGKSVAVPFVGATAATLVISEAVRSLHDGPAYFDIRVKLGNPNDRWTRSAGVYMAGDATGLAYVRSRKPQ